MFRWEVLYNVVVVVVFAPWVDEIQRNKGINQRLVTLPGGDRNQRYRVK